MPTRSTDSRRTILRRGEGSQEGAARRYQGAVPLLVRPGLPLSIDSAEGARRALPLHGYGRERTPDLRTVRNVGERHHVLQSHGQGQEGTRAHRTFVHLRRT